MWAGDRAQEVPVTALLFLAIVVVVVVVGGVILWLTSRSPSSPKSSIDAFRREMDALSPKDVSAGDSGRPRDGSA